MIKVTTMQERVKKFHKFFVSLTTLFIVFSPFLSYAGFKIIDKPAVRLSKTAFLEDTLGETSSKHYAGDTITTAERDYRFFNFYPYPELSLRLEPCSELVIDDLRYNQKSKLALIALTLKGAHFCPTQPKLVINKDNDISISLDSKVEIAQKDK